MTVATEVSYAERSWTGAETDFAPGMSAQDVSHITVKYRDAIGALTPLTAGVHYSVAKAGDAGETGAISMGPLNMPSAPGTVVIERVTPATQSVDFEALEDFDPVTHTKLHDAAALRGAELRNRQNRAITPFTVYNDYADFSPRRAAGADPVNDKDFATKGYVLQITGILSLQGFVTQAQTYANNASASATNALTAQTAAQAARDKAQLWSDQAEDTIVQGTEYSAFHWSRKAAASAAIVAVLAANLDYGTFSVAPTSTTDFGSTWP